jgi:hypothetical protein
MVEATRVELRKRAMILNTETRQMKTYRDKANNPMNVYMTEELNVPSRDLTDEGSSTTCMARRPRPDQYRGACY